MTLIWESAKKREHGMIKLATPLAVNLETAGQYYKIPGTYDTGVLSYHFTVNAAGKLTYNGPKGIFLMNGISDVQVNKLCTITYATKKNAEFLSDTSHIFATADRNETLATTNLVQLVQGDYLEVYAKSTTVNTLVTPATLKVTFYGGII
jgi:hypothetical protein